LWQHECQGFVGDLTEQINDAFTGW